MCKIPNDKMQLTKAVHAYPKKHGLTIEWIANELWNRFEIDIAHSTLERQLNPNDTPKLPGDLIGYICQICNNDFSAIDLITIEPASKKVKNRTVARFMKEVGEASATLSEALEDGRIDREEKPKCIKEVMDAKEVLDDILSRLIK